MDDAIGLELRRIVLQYGTGICEDARRLEALLRDLSGEHRREIFVLTGAVREGVADELMSSQGMVPATVVAERLTQRLQDNLGLQEDAARWAIATWASALDVPGTTSSTSAGDAAAELAGPAVESAGYAPARSVPPPGGPGGRERLLALPLDDAGDVAWAVLGVLTAAAGPLSMGDMAGILNLPVRQVHRAIEPIADLIVRDGLLEASGDPIRQTVTGYLGQAERRSHEQALTRWCLELAASGERGPDFPDYVARHGAAALAAAGDVRALCTLVDREWMRLSGARTGSLSAFTSDIRLAAQAAAAQDPPDRLQELRASLATVTSSAIAASVPPEVLGVLAMAGQGKRAMDLAGMVASEFRSDGHYRIATALRGSGDAGAADAATAAAIESAVSHARESGNYHPLQVLTRSIHNSGTPDWALRALAALQAEVPDDTSAEFLAVAVHADAGDVDGAWEAARLITNSTSRDLALANHVVEALAGAGRIQDAISAAESAEGNPGRLLGKVADVTAEAGDVAATMTVIRSVPAASKVGAVTQVGKIWARAGRVDDALTITQIIDDADRRKNAVKAVAGALAEAGQADRALSIWTAAASDEDRDYGIADLAAKAASAGDIDNALQIAAAIGDGYYRQKALTHAASAAASDGDLSRATAVVRMIGDQSDEDDAFAALAKDLAAGERFDHAIAAIDLITGARKKAESQVAAAGSLAAAGDYLRSASLADKAAEVAETLGSHAVYVSALITWARALTRSTRASEAVSAAERAVNAAEVAADQELLVDALAAWSGALAISGREEEASAVATRAVAAIESEESEDGPWRSNPEYWRERRAESVAVILAEAGPPEQAILAARSLTDDYDRDKALTEVAARLARRGLADQAIEALQASPHFTFYEAEKKFGELTQILATHGHADGALQAAYALANVDGTPDYVDYEIAEKVRDAARILAENGRVDAALSAVRASRPSWNRPRAFTTVACATALTGDVGRGAEIAETTGGYPALAVVAAALAESGALSEAVPLAERAVRLALAAPPKSPATTDAVAALERLARSVADKGEEGTEQAGAASLPPDELAAHGRQMAEEARLIADPGERAMALGNAAAAIAPANESGLQAEAATLARQAADEARAIADPGERAMALGNAAAAAVLVDEPALAVEWARECLTAAAASRGYGAADPGAWSAIAVLVDAGNLTEALAGIGSLKNDMTKAAALCDVANRLAAKGETENLLRLARDTEVIDHIIGAHAQISALTGLGRILVKLGETSLASGLADDVDRRTQELTQAYEKAVALADQAELLVQLGRCPEAVNLADQALAIAQEPIGGWRDQVITKVVEVLIQCERVDDAVNAAKSAPAESRTASVAAVAAALFEAGEQDHATNLISDEFSVVRAVGGRSAFYDLICTHLPQHKGLFLEWLGSGTEIAQVSQELAEIERWWAP